MKRFIRRLFHKLHFLATTNRLAVACQSQRRIWEIRRRARECDEIRIIVGSSGTRQDGWIATEQKDLDLLERSSWLKLFRPASVSAILAEHVWEHLSEEEGLVAAKHCFEFLKPGGYLRCAVPDGMHPSDQYIAWVRPGGIGAGSDDHQILYDFQSLSRLFRCAGFDIDLLEYHDQDRQFHAIDWDPSQGMIVRSIRFDAQARGTDFLYTSLIVDAIRPSVEQTRQPDSDQSTFR